HFNPLVTLAFAATRRFPAREVPVYLAAQFVGALAGVLAAHAMFDLPLLQVSPMARSSIGQWWSEVVATFGLILEVLTCDGRERWSAPLAVGAYIAAAYWFTASM